MLCLFQRARGVEMAHFSLYFTFASSTIGEARVEAQMFYVAMSHALLIKLFLVVFILSAYLRLHFKTNCKYIRACSNRISCCVNWLLVQLENVLSKFYFNSCARIRDPSLFNLIILLHYLGPHARTAEAISALAIIPIKLQVLRCLDCIYFCFVDANSFCEPGVTVTTESSGAPDEEEDIVTKGRVGIFVGELIEENLGETKEKSQSKSKNGSANRNALFLRHCWLRRCLGWPPPRARFIYSRKLRGPANWRSAGGRIYTPHDKAVGGSAGEPEGNCDLEFCSAIVTYEGWFDFLNVFDTFATVLIQLTDPGAPQGSRGPLGVTDLFGMLVLHRTVPGAPQGSFGWRPHRLAPHRHLWAVRLEPGASLAFVCPALRSLRLSSEATLRRGNQQTGDDSTELIMT